MEPTVELNEPAFKTTHMSLAPAVPVSINCYGVWYTDVHEWSGFVSYHATKKGAYKKMRDLILEAWHNQTDHPNDLKWYKKHRDRHRYFGVKYQRWTIKQHTIEIEA